MQYYASLLIYISNPLSSFAPKRRLRKVKEHEVDPSKVSQRSFGTAQRYNASSVIQYFEITQFLQNKRYWWWCVWGGGASLRHWEAPSRDRVDKGNLDSTFLPFSFSHSVSRSFLLQGCLRSHTKCLYLMYSGSLAGLRSREVRRNARNVSM